MILESLGFTSVGRTARLLGLPLRRGGRGSGRARPFFPSSTEDGGAGELLHLCDFGPLAALRTVARVPWDPRFTPSKYIPLTSGHLTLGPGLGTRQKDVGVRGTRQVTPWPSKRSSCSHKGAGARLAARTTPAGFGVLPLQAYRRRPEPSNPRGGWAQRWTTRPRSGSRP